MTTGWLGSDATSRYWRPSLLDGYEEPRTRPIFDNPVVIERETVGRAAVRRLRRLFGDRQARRRSAVRRLEWLASHSTR